MGALVHGNALSVVAAFAGGTVVVATTLSTGVTAVFLAVATVAIATAAGVAARDASDAGHRRAVAEVRATVAITYASATTSGAVRHALAAGTVLARRTTTGRATYFASRAA